MTTPLQIVISDAGRAALIDAEGGGTTAIVIGEVGITASAFVAAPTLTALPGEIKRIDAVPGLAADADTVHLVVRDSSDDEYTVRGLAFYLADGTLFAAYSQADPIVGKFTASHLLTAIDLKFIDGEAALIEFGAANFLNPPATEDEKGVAYLATVIEALAGAVNDKIITPATMAAVLANYVATDQLGVAEGVATLGPDGKLLLAQRPPIDTFQVFVVANEAAMLALSDADPGNFAVREDNGLVYVLQSSPAATLANWIEISTPAPVSSVNGLVGAVTLVPGDLGAVPTGRTVTGGGLATGGGDLSVNRVITVPKASQADVAAGTDDAKALTALAVAAAFAAKAPVARQISGGGLITGGGDLSANRTLTLAAASAAEIVAGVEAGKAVTPAELAALPQSLTPNGYITLPGGLKLQWVQYRSLITSELSFWVSYPVSFTSFVVPLSVTGYTADFSLVRDLWMILQGEPGLSGCYVQSQSDDSFDRRLDGFNLILLGK